MKQDSDKVIIISIICFTIFMVALVVSGIFEKTDEEKTKQLEIQKEIIILEKEKCENGNNSN